jgi:hypothetical protein
MITSLICLAIIFLVFNTFHASIFLVFHTFLVSYCELYILNNTQMVAVSEKTKVFLHIAFLLGIRATLG